MWFGEKINEQIRKVKVEKRYEDTLWADLFTFVDTMYIPGILYL